MGSHTSRPADEGPRVVVVYPPPRNNVVTLQRSSPAVLHHYRDPLDGGLWVLSFWCDSSDGVEDSVVCRGDLTAVDYAYERAEELLTVDDP